ncbi:MAG: protein kinase [Siculibacillus sp.]|nr:protein kinase [Siculibacillus sp.]
MTQDLDKTHRGWLPAGTRLNDTYEIETGIAAGGMGEIYRGHNIQTGDAVAIKMIRSDLAETDSVMAMFRKEASALNKLYHEAIVRYYGFSVDPTLKRPYMAMEFVVGKSLSEIVKDGPLSWVDVCVLGIRVASGLQVAHERGIIHRDISPDNIIIHEGDVAQAKIIDFGIARQTKSEGTIVGDGLAGKYNYMSPEQLGLNGGDVRGVSDIYSFGLVLVEASTGRPLNMRGNPVELIEKRRKVPDLDHVPGRLRPLIAAMLQPEPQDRPPTMRAVAEWLAGELDRSFGDVGRGEGGEERTVVSSAAPRVPTSTFGSQRPIGGSAMPRADVYAQRSIQTPPVDWDAPSARTGRSEPDRPASFAATGAKPDLPHEPTLPGPSMHEPDGSGTVVARPASSAEVSALRSTGAFAVSRAPSTPLPASQPPASRWSQPPPSTPPSRSASPRTSAAPSRSAPPPPSLDVGRGAPPAPAPIAAPRSAPASRPAGPVEAPRVASEAKKSSALPLVAAIVGLLVVGGGGAAWFLTSGSSQKTTVASQGSTSKPGAPSAGVPPRPTGPTDRTTAPRVGTAELARFVADFAGGDCFFLDPVVIAEGRLVTEGFGRSIVPFESFDEAFRDRHGFEADIRLRQVTAAQCPIVDLLKRARAGGGAEAKIELRKNHLRAGELLAGAVGAQPGDLVSVVVVESDGTARVVAPPTAVEKSLLPFVTAAKREADVKGGQPDLVVAFAANRSLASLTSDKPVPVITFVEALDKEASAAGVRIAAAARYVVVGN